MTWAVGGPCRAVYVEDGLEYEATIEDISLSDNGDKYATVELLGHGDRLTVWLVDLVESHGQAARDQQEAAVRVSMKADANGANHNREEEEANAKAFNSKKEVEAQAEDAKVLLEKKEAEAREAKALQEKKDAEARAAEAKALQEKKEAKARAAEAKALQEKNEAEARAAEAKAVQEKKEAEARATEVKALEEATLKANDPTHSTLQNPALAPSISSSQASEFQLSQTRTASDMPEAEGQQQVEPAVRYVGDHILN